MVTVTPSTPLNNNQPPSPPHTHRAASVRGACTTACGWLALLSARCHSPPHAHWTGWRLAGHWPHRCVREMLLVRVSVRVAVWECMTSYDVSMSHQCVQLEAEMLAALFSAWHHTCCVVLCCAVWMVVFVGPPTHREVCVRCWRARGWLWRAHACWCSTHHTPSTSKWVCQCREVSRSGGFARAHHCFAVCPD